MPALGRSESGSFAARLGGDIRARWKDDVDGTVPLRSHPQPRNNAPEEGAQVAQTVNAHSCEMHAAPSLECNGTGFTIGGSRERKLIWR